MTPEFDSGAAHEACAPLHWDAKEWDFRASSEDDESLTDGEDLQFLLDGELEDEDNDDESWDGYDSSSEDDDDGDDDGDSDNGADSDDDSSSDDGAGDDGSDGAVVTAVSAQVL
jgi:hypothetical protein